MIKMNGESLEHSVMRFKCVEY